MPVKNDQWKATIQVDKRYSTRELESIASEIKDFIIERTQDKHLDKRNRQFAGYSDSYKHSLAFKVGGKSNAVDLTLSGDMLAALDVLDTRPGVIEIGFEKGSTENAKAEGNILGTYGKDKQVAPKRDFLGITKGDLNKILAKYPINDEDTRAISTARETFNREVVDFVFGGL